MKEQYAEFLYARHPKILSRVKADGLAIGDGWLNLIDLLCTSLQNLTDHNGAPQVVACQVKQKFGGLRFYVNDHSSEQGVLIDQAELMAQRTCEICGAPGKRVSLDGWVVATCIKHKNAFRKPPKGPRQIRVFVDMDDVLTAFRPAFEAVRAAEPASLWPQSTPGFFSELEPLPHAVKGMLVLDALAGVEVHILTAPSPRNAHSYTEKRLWIERHLGYRFVKRLHISPRKDLFRGDVLIDDNHKGKGQDNFEGALLKFGSDFCPDWPSTVVRLVMLRGADPWPSPVRERLTGCPVGERQGTARSLEAGLSPLALNLMAWLLALAETQLAEIISAAESDISEWRESGRIPQTWSRRLYDVAHLFDRALIMMRADVDKTRRWLSSALPVLIGRSPLGYLMEENAISDLDKIIDKIEEGFP
ncbi:MAG: hypothetical protein P1U64_11505 [Alcanivoracaceae bacterium]|jgi:putative toxin-antitoxin system antitoxin component (TIGR02293 family)|nr:hypothetical protein [Alcanivoracaceae bacterium]